MKGEYNKSLEKINVSKTSSDALSLRADVLHTNIYTKDTIFVFFINTPHHGLLVVLACVSVVCVHSTPFGKHAPVSLSRNRGQIKQLTANMEWNSLISPTIQS